MNEQERAKAIQEHIEWCRSQRDWAAEKISDFDKGEKWFRSTGGSPPENVTDRWRERLEKRIKSMDRIIDACGSP